MSDSLDAIRRRFRDTRAAHESDPEDRKKQDAYDAAARELTDALRALLPHGWEGDLDEPAFNSLVDVESWLSRRLSALRDCGICCTSETTVAATAIAARDLRNFRRILDHLGIATRPSWDTPANFNESEACLSDLLAWVCRQLPDEPYSGLTLFTGQGITTLGQLRVALLSEEQNAPPPDMFQLCSGDQRRVLEMLETHKALTGEFRSLPAVRRAESICQQRYGQSLTKESLDRIRCEYHYETGNPFRVANNEQIGRVLDVVEQIPLRAYRAAIAGLPDQAPAVATDSIIAEFEQERETGRESSPTVTPEGQAAAQRWQSIVEERRALERFAEQTYRQDLLAAGFAGAEIGAGNHVRHVEGDDPRKPAFTKANLEYDRRIKAIGPWLQRRYAPPATEPLDQAPPATGGSEQGEADADKKQKRKRRQRGRKRGDYDEARNQKIYAAYLVLAKDSKSNVSKADVCDSVADRFAVTADDVRLIVKRHREREKRKHKHQPK